MGTHELSFQFTMWIIYQFFREYAEELCLFVLRRKIVDGYTWDYQSGTFTQFAKTRFLIANTRNYNNGK